jgi:hypothetical protein
MYGAMTLMILVAVLGFSTALGWGAAMGVLCVFFRMLEIFQSGSSAHQNAASALRMIRWKDEGFPITVSSGTLLPR